MRNSIPPVFLFLIPLLFFSSLSSAQTGSVKGHIYTSDQQPAALVNVQLKEIKTGTSTSEDGSYELKNIPEGNYTLIVSFIGLQTKHQNIIVAGNQASVYNFILEENKNELSEIIITASRSMNERTASAGKIAIKPMDLPQSIAVINKDILERQQVMKLSDALINVNGLYVYGTTGGSQEEIGARGYAFGTGNTFKNGIRFNNRIMPEMSSLEKLEVIKGSTAILYGNVAAGGILNLVTKKPKFEKGGELSFRAGSYDFYKPSIDICGPLSPSVAYRINTSYEKANSYRDNVASERYYINPSFLFKLGTKTELIVEGDYINDTRTSDFGTGAIDYVIASIPRSRFLGAAWSYNKSKQGTATATLTHHINTDWQFQAVAAAQKFSTDLYGTTRPNASGQLIKEDGTWIRGLQRSGSEEDYYIVQTDLTGLFNTGKLTHHFLAGADADKYVTDANTYTYTNPALGNKNIYDTINIFDLTAYKQRNDIPEITPVTSTHTPTGRFGVYIQDLVEISPKLKVLAGGRFSYQETAKGYIDSLIKNERTATIGTSDRAFTPRLGIVFQPRKTISFFTSYANSFTLNSGTDIYLQPLAPSYIDQVEGGIKTELFKKQVSANITVYKIINSNMAQTALTDVNGNPNNNRDIKELAGEVTSKGIEIDLSTKTIHGFSFIGGYSFNDTRYTKSNTYIEGSRLRYNPQHTANASIYYSFGNRALLKGVNAGITGYYVGERVAGRSTRITVANDAFKLMSVPDYVQVDASLGYSIDKYAIRLKISNIFNRLSYYIHDDNSVNPIAPRQYSASVSFKL